MKEIDKYQELCQLFSSISEIIWDTLAKNSQRSNFLPEEGITKGVILDKVLDYINERKTSFIYAQSVKNERLNGGDLEIYYEYDRDQYVRLFFQAKIIKKGGRFSGLLQENSKGKQIELLKEFEEIAGCKTYYLFYNGIPDFKFNHNDCTGEYNEKQLGCTIVETNKVKELIEQYGDKIKHDILYNKEDLKGSPWRMIPCCLMRKGNNSGLRIYTYSEINSDPSFKPLYYKEEQKSNTLSYKQSPPSSEILAINRRLKTEGYSPGVRLVLTQTEPQRK